MITVFVRPGKLVLVPTSTYAESDSYIQRLNSWEFVYEKRESLSEQKNAGF